MWGRPCCGSRREARAPSLPCRPPPRHETQVRVHSIGGARAATCCGFRGYWRGVHLRRGRQLRGTPCATMPTFYLNGFAAGPCWTSQSRRVRLPIPVLHSPASPGESAPWEGFREARVQFSPSPANATAQASAELTLQCESRRHKLQTRWELNKTRASCPRSLVARFGRPRWCPWWCLPVVVGSAVHVRREGWDQWG